MRTAPSVVLALALTLFSPTAHGQQPAQSLPQRDPEAVALLTSSLAACGGSALGALATPSGPSLVATGRHATFTPDGPVERTLRVKLLGYDKVRWEADEPEGTSATVINGGTGWNISAEGTVQLPISQALSRKLQLFPFLAVAEALNSQRASVQLLEPAMIAGRSYRHIGIDQQFAGDSSAEFQAKFQRMSRWELYLDPQSLLPVRLRYYEHPDDWRRDVAVDVVYSDFRSVGGVLVPFAVTRYLGSGKLDEFRFDSVALGAPVSAAEFTR